MAGVTKSRKTGDAAKARLTVRIQTLPFASDERGQDVCRVRARLSRTGALLAELVGGTREARIVLHVPPGWSANVESEHVVRGILRELTDAWRVAIAERSASPAARSPRRRRAASRSPRSSRYNG